MSLHDLIDVVQSEAEARDAALAVLLMHGSTAELVEDDALVFAGDADAVIAHLQQDVLVAALRRDADFDVFLRVLDGIVDEIGDGFGEILFVGEDVTFEQIHDEIDVFIRFGLRLLHDIIDDGFQVYVLFIQDEFLVFELRDGKQLVDECQQVLRLTLDDGVVFLLDRRFVIDLAAVEEPRTHDDARQRRLHVVNHRVGEVVAKVGHHLLLVEIAQQPQQDGSEENEDDGTGRKERAEPAGKRRIGIIKREPDAARLVATGAEHPRLQGGGRQAVVVLTEDAAVGIDFHQGEITVEAHHAEQGVDILCQRIERHFGVITPTEHVVHALYRRFQREVAAQMGQAEGIADGDDLRPLIALVEHTPRQLIACTLRDVGDGRAVRHPHVESQQQHDRHHRRYRHIFVFILLHSCLQR